jgi:5'-nucleotidase/UDP-sugar diphosphatase
LRKRIAESDFTWLGANVVDRGNPKSIFGGATGQLVREVGGIRVGIFGVCTEETPNLSFPDEDVEFLPALAVARECVRSLREDHHVDIVVAMTHLPLPADKEIAKKVAGIDLILGGHDHHPVQEMIDRTLVVKCGHDAHWLGRIDVRLHSDAEGKPRPALSWSLTANVGVAPDPAMEALLSRYRVQVDDGDTVLCEFRVPVVSTTSRVRTQEASFPSVVSDALREMLSADIGIINGGFVRGDREYKAGHKFTRLDLSKELPFPNPTRVVSAPGSAIRQALEEILQVSPHLTGGFPHPSGILVTFDHRRPALDRITSITYSDGTPFDSDRVHTVALTSFMADGGDGVKAWKVAKEIPSPMPGASVATVLAAYFKQFGILHKIRYEGKRILNLATA